MIEVLYVMIRTRKLFDSMPENILNRKLTQYGLCNKNNGRGLTQET
ncbi:hypothetical protein LEP1GSC096_0251 [Leptospira interrogans serovar Hebdomadis str. R499]|nr:hypothetical protein LEP1GSC096_0251 [Leptospira interrogans serovar Hebdomadis str. R499]EKR82632.1 hypothetical protein LEP1GSC099_2754 [Leptospira interrogans str. UI 08452]EMN35955.1 hypothetical protein LEP1GSC084_3679 [Leptospira interrogans serovar Medanensis str. L0448]EMN41784.1 hypothetical protein LEP1GSC085_3534 [Leptospira interrogans str. L0996]